MWTPFNGGHFCYRTSFALFCIFRKTIHCVIQEKKRIYEFACRKHLTAISDASFETTLGSGLFAF